MSDELSQDAALAGNYEVIRGRLMALADRVQAAADALNTRRQATFGSGGMTLVGNDRLRTENNCVPADLVQVGGHLLLGFNVFLGLRKQTAVADVLGLHDLVRADAGVTFQPVADEVATAWLHDRSFLRELDELYQYYKDTRLIQLRNTGTKLLAVFQIGATARDVKVMRWSVDPGGRITYIDNRGERDHVFPPRFDFEWTRTTRDDHVMGRHPHVNILDTVFVETVGGDLTIKVEDNTTDGTGIYQEPVDDPSQSLDDAIIEYAKRGSLILLRIQPYRETAYRHLVYNPTTRTVTRIDAIGDSCTSLPEDHGILFPGGYYLRTGETKIFDSDVAGMELFRAIPSPNGEDVLFVFHRRTDGQYGLYPYNVIRKEVASPIHAHGFSLTDDGTLVVLRATPEPTRVHAVQVWSTTFCSPEHHQTRPADGSLLGRIGNRDLVRGISDAFTLVRLIRDQQPTRAMYEELVGACRRFVDAYLWASEAEVGDLRSLAEETRKTAELVIDEFDKVQALRRTAVEALAKAEAEQAKILADVRPNDFQAIEPFLQAMSRLRTWRGHLITLQEVRYIDVPRLKAMEDKVIAAFDAVGARCATFLMSPAAFQPLVDGLEALATEAGKAPTTTALQPHLQRLDELATGVSLLGEVAAGLEVPDPADKTRMLDGVTEVVGHANRVRAILDTRRKALARAEGEAEFQVRFKLLGQAVAGEVARAETPEACDDGMSRMLLQLEELEGRFGELDAFLPQLAARREEITTAFGARKQTLLEERQRRVSALVQTAERILDGLRRRGATLPSEDELQAYFAADPMVLKLRQLIEQLGAIDALKAEDLTGKLKGARQDALRALRDKVELFDGGTNLIRFGKHRFTVHTQPLELALVPHGAGLAVHLNGTELHEPVDDPALAGTERFWTRSVTSESPEVYRGEYLAWRVFDDALRRDGMAALLAIQASTPQLLEVVRAAAADRHDEGYERGVHDHDAALLLGKLVGMYAVAGLLRFSPEARGLCALYLAFGPDDERTAVEAWRARARVLVAVRQVRAGAAPALAALADEVGARLSAFADASGVPRAADAGACLVEVLGTGARIAFGAEAAALASALRPLVDEVGRGVFDDMERALADRWVDRWGLLRACLAAAVSPSDGAVAAEAATLLLVERKVEAEVSHAQTSGVVSGLLGQHPRIVDGGLAVRLDELTARVARFDAEEVPAFRGWRALRHRVLDDARRRLRIDELKPRAMSSFVRNQLINEVYLPLVGDNLAKQLGAAGESKRTDLMGLLLLVSPPGYGKTTLMEYVAGRLGLVFVKVNGPALGHQVTSLDPKEAPNATARQEVDKVNLALEMATNVMLYVDDIQHCNPEFLQKFISLCDATRKIEGVWRGRSRTYDLRGKKFCVVMAGNPYTETGAKFRIPDMLANRADTYNLGEVLGGREDAFALSFVENALTSNPTLAPLAARAQQDVYKLIRMARGEEVPASELSHGYGAGELADILAVLRHLLQIQRTVLTVNAAYVRSAATEDAFRTEPRFQLQGSYRNMNKMAEKVVPVLTPAEVEALITDHYAGESQTLAAGAEANLLKLGELRGTLTEAEATRWAQILTEFRRRQMMGAEDDPAGRIAGVIAGLVQEVGQLGRRVDDGVPTLVDALGERLDALAEAAAAPTAAMATLDARLAALSTSVEGAAGKQAAALVRVGDRLGEQLAKTAPVEAAIQHAGAVLGERVGGLAATVESLARRPRDKADWTPLLAAIDRLGHALGRRDDPGLAAMLAEVRAMRDALMEAAVEAQDVMVMTESTDPSVAPSRRVQRPEERVAEARAALLQQARAAVDGTPHLLPATAHATLVGAVAVVEDLATALTEAARPLMAPADHATFVEALKVRMAGALQEVAKGVYGAR